MPLLHAKLTSGAKARDNMSIPVARLKPCRFKASHPFAKTAKGWGTEVGAKRYWTVSVTVAVWVSAPLPEPAVPVTVTV